MVQFPGASASAEAAQRRRCSGIQGPGLPRALKLLSGGAALGFIPVDFAWDFSI